MPPGDLRTGPGRHPSTGYAPHITPAFRHGEIVRVARSSGDSPARGSEGVVEEIAGPDDEGAGWTVTVRIAAPGAGDSLVLLPESDLEATGFAEDERGDRVPLESRPPEELRDSIELRLFTEIVDGIEAARVAQTIERELIALLGGSDVSIEAERHWSAPYNYELLVTIHPLDDPTKALRALAEEGDGGWLSCRDDGWRCDLWWSGAEDPGAVLVVPDVRRAKVAYLPWRSPSRRAEEDRPLVTVDVPDTFDEPEEPGPDELET